MPAAPIDIDPDVYLSAGELFLAVNGTVCDLVADAATTAGAGGGMAGTDSSGVSWAEGYDDAAATALTAGAALADSLGHVGQLLSCSAANHAGADAASVPGGPPSYPGDGSSGGGSGSGAGAASVLPATPPSADGTPGDPPHGWFLIAHLLQYTWPNGHQDQLRTVAAGWRRASSECDLQADRLTRAITDISALASPEVPAAVATCSEVQQCARDLAGAYATMGDSCSDYAAHLDEAHSEVLRELAEFAAETAAIQIVAAVAAAATAGGGEVAGQAAQGARTAATAAKVSRVLAKLADFVRAVTGAVRAVLTRIADVLRRLKVVLAKGTEGSLAEIASQFERVASCDVRKFSEYVFREGATHGKARVFESYGYGKADSAELTDLFTREASAKFLARDYQLGKSSPYGQFITIMIELPGRGTASGTAAMIKTGWLVRADGTISLNTPFAGWG